MRWAYANSLRIGVASIIHPFKPLFNTWGGGGSRGGGKQNHSGDLAWVEGCKGGEVKKSCEPLEFSSSLF